jgi:Spy/CpxP family protein refolding chaperone
MKYARVLLLVLAAAVFVAPVASAQGGGGGGRGRGMQALMQNITLTAEQQVKVDSITTKYRTERQALMPAGGGGMAGMDSTARAKMLELNNKQYDEIRAVLTEDQQKVFDENRKNLPQGRRGGGTGNR